MQNLPKWLVSGLGALLIVLVAVSIADKAWDLKDHDKVTRQQNTFMASGEGKVKAVPDLATVTLGVVSQGATAAVVQDQNSQKINKIIEFVKQQGVSRDDIATSQFNIYPQYNYNNGKNEIIGYEARQSITIKVKGVDKSSEGLGKIISGATGNGANEISNVTLGFENPENLRQEAKTKAIENAKVRAQELAKAAGIELGRVVNVSENNAGSPMPYYGEGYGGAGGLMMDKAASPNIEPGNQDIVETVTLTFEIK